MKLENQFPLRKARVALYPLILVAGLLWSLTGAAFAQNGPIRMVRFSLINGDASWRPDANSSWQDAQVNLPLNQGAQVWVPDNSKAELQFDDGSFMRLRGGTLAILQTLTSDSSGEYTEIQMVSGSAFFQIINPHSSYQVDTPQTTAKTSGPATIRVGVSNLSSICVHVGLVQVHGSGGSFTLHPHEYVSMAPEATSYDVQPLPNPDSWDQWNNQREYSLDSYSSEVPQGALPPNIALAAPALSEYGDWQYVPHYGRCWHPHEHYGWQPYRAGHWVACQPYGWTWVSDEDWGWAPYHYGIRVRLSSTGRRLSCTFAPTMAMSPGAPWRPKKSITRPRSASASSVMAGISPSPSAAPPSIWRVATAFAIRNPGASPN